jgi:hypothetical protein
MRTRIAELFRVGFHDFAPRTVAVASRSVALPDLSPFLVELERPELLALDVRALADRSRAVTEEMRGEGTHVRFLRTIYVPEDGRCFLLFEGGCRADVSEAVGRVDVATATPVESINVAARP